MFRYLGIVVALIVVWFFFVAGNRPTSRPVNTPPLWGSSPQIQPLTLSGMWSLTSEIPGRFDPSGLTYWPEKNLLLTVNDKLDDIHLFAINPFQAPPSGVLQAKSILKSKVHIPRIASTVWKNYWMSLDLEGIAYCDQHAIVVGEETRLLFRVHPTTGQYTRHALDVQDYMVRSAYQRHPMAGFSLDSNAGYEGIACDSQRKQLYVMQERQPRAILVVAMPTQWKDGQNLRIIRHFDLPGFSLPRNINGINSEPDFAGADIDGAFLYVLYRNERLVMKVDPQRSQLVDVRSYRHAEQGLYQQRNPFGLAEGLVVRKDRIWIVLDNNNRPRVSNPQDRRPVLLSFIRPKGF